MLKDAEYIYDYIYKVLGIKEENIILFGRSIGSGPATHLASKNNPCSLLLMSPFKSIRSVAEIQAGKLLKYLIKDQFDNLKKMKTVRCPTFIIHGQKDQLIPWQHSKELY